VGIEAPTGGNVTVVAEVVEVDHEIEGGCRPPRSREHRLFDLASRQHDLVARRQLTRMGFGPGAIDTRVHSGRLTVVHRGVYSVSPSRLTRLGRWLAAVLAGGDEAVLSHNDAAALWGLVRPAGGIIHVSVPRGRARARSGIRFHHPRDLGKTDREIREGIPVTGLPRTLLDLAAVDPSRLGRALEEADRRNLLQLQPLRALLSRSRGRPGAAVLRRGLERLTFPEATRSELETRFLELCLEHGLPRPSVNVLVAGHLVDAAWLERRLVVEMDGFAYHRSRAAFERDRERDADLQLAGFRVLRVTAQRLERDRKRLAAALAALLAQERGRIRESPKEPS
jgi:hypothetical protein